MKALFNFNVKELNECNLEKAETLGKLRTAKQELEDARDCIKELEAKQKELQKEIKTLKQFKGQCERLKEQLLVANDRASVYAEYLDKFSTLADETALMKFNV